MLAAFDEAPTIASVVRDVIRHTPSLLEVVVVDDGSRDDTAARAEAAGANVLRMGRNRGKGVALRRGIAHARGEVLIFLDADGQDDPAQIPNLLDELDSDVDMVIGSRFLGRFARGAITPINRAGTRMLTATMNALFGTRITDPIAGFRVVRARPLAACRLTAVRYDIELDILLALLARGARVVEVPVDRYPRRHGRSDLSSVRDGTRMLLKMLSRRARRPHENRLG